MPLHGDVTELSIPVVVIALDALLEVAQADCQMTRPAKVNNEMASALSRRSCMVIVLVICSLHLHVQHQVNGQLCLG